MLNGALECQLREYIIFEGDYRTFRREGGRLREAEEKRRERLDDLHDSRKRLERRERRKFDHERGGRFDRKPRPDGEERPFSEKRRERRRDLAGKPRNKLEERYRPTGHRDESFRPQRKPDTDAAPVRPESDNPLAQRRNPAALRSITGKQPSLGGPVMRVRKGWKKTGDSTESNS